MVQSNTLIRPETPADYQAVERLTREAFWNVYRPGCLAHYIVHSFRHQPDFVPELDLVLEKAGKLIGHVMYVRARIQTDDGWEIPVMTFGPLSIHPDCQRQGLGKLLLDYSMSRARALGVGALCIKGDPAFYGESGFAAAGDKGLRYDGEPEGQEPPYFLVKELQKGFLDGVTGTYHMPKGYQVDEREAEEFDKIFCPKTN